MINITDAPYSAVGDGVNDNTAAILSALGDANSTNVANVFAPNGAFKTGKIDWPGNNLSLHGTASGFGYDSTANVRTKFKAKPGAAIIFDLVQTGAAQDRTGNHLYDFEVDGDGTAAVGIDMSGANIVERVRATGCTSAGFRLSNLTNRSKVNTVNARGNLGYGMEISGVSTTPFTVSDSVLTVNTVGGLLIAGGVNGVVRDTVIESNTGPGLVVRRPNTHTNDFGNFDFDRLWFEGNASVGDGYAIVIDAETRSEANAPHHLRFYRNHIGASYNNRRYAFIGCGRDILFEECEFSTSTLADALTLTQHAYRVRFINCTGLSSTQVENAISSGTRCWWHNDGVKLYVGGASPAVPFQNGWQNFGGTGGIGTESAAYWFDAEGDVHLQGFVKGGTALNTTVFVLPAAYRPQQVVFRNTRSNSGNDGYVKVWPDGRVQVTSGDLSGTNINLTYSVS